MSLDHILLGLLRSPQSGYDLKREIDTRVRYFWQAEFSQIYPVLRRLEKGGFVRSRTVASDKGPDRRVYSLTAAGRRELRDWVLDPPELGSFRVEFVAKLYFLAASEQPARAEQFIEELREQMVIRLDALREIEAEWPGGDGHDTIDDETFHQHLALRAGVTVMEARVGWCDECLGRIRKRSASLRKRSPSFEKEKQQ